MPKKKTAAKKRKKTSKNKKGQRILWFKDVGIGDIDLVGGKNASLGEMYRHLTKKGVRIPNGFTITAFAYRDFLRSAGIDKNIKELAKHIVVNDVKELARVAKQIRTTILSAPFPKALERDIVRAYAELSKKKKTIAVAVRSSATAEDLPGASFAGQQETYLNIRGQRRLLDAVKKCMASLFTARAVSYREERGFDHTQVALSVTVQEMVRAENGASGVLFTIDTESGFRGVTLINAAYGLGEYVVKGKIVPDQFYIFNAGLEKGKKAIISRTLGTKESKLGYAKTSGTKHMSVSRRDRNRFCISDEDVLQLAKWGRIIEEHYGGKPQDIEWAKDGKTGELFIVQARPETVQSGGVHAVIETYRLKKTGTALVRGTAVGQKIGAGKARILKSPKDIKQFKKGDVLVTRVTDPDWEPIMRIASAIVTEQGGKTSHAAIVSRELGTPCIVGAKNATNIIKNNQRITASCASGEEGIVYRGILPFERERTELKDIPKTKTKMMMNVGDPDNAFALSFLPHDGVGLARQEFIFSNFIRIHPLALVHYRTLKDAVAKKKIKDMTRGYRRKTDYCVEKLAEGIGRIAAASYPRDVVLRLSDFKSNEYASLIGGKAFEPKEANPMLGWRGASRYYSKEYKPAFALECAAIKKVREDWGLDNVVVMVPFCRTPEEGSKVIKTMERFGLKRGENGLRVYVMCEIPSNVILAEEFAKIFDGFSIGSNDLTQLALGVDRDSALVSTVYDENSPAIKTLIRDVIATAHKHKRPVGICGQAPSDFPEFVDFLVRAGIDSISLNPDTVVAVRKRVASIEKTLGKTGRKTHKTFLGLVAAVGILAASLIGFGAGCASPSASPSATEISEHVSPAMIRARTAEQTLIEEARRFARLSVSDFANFEINYPNNWQVSYWNGGVTLSDEKTGEYISIFRQLIENPVASTEKRIFVVDGKEAKYFQAAEEGGTRIDVVEFPLGEGDVLEINGSADRFDDIVGTLRVGHMAPDRPLNHWDIRDGRICVAVLTYARAESAAACTPFPTPCDVPDGWEVCDGDAI